MAESRRDPGLIALIGAFAILAAAVLGMLLLFQDQQRAQAEVTHTLEVEQQLSTVLSRLQDAETGQRGYLITHDPQYLQPYFAGTRQLEADLRALKALVSDNPGQTERVEQLMQAARGRVERLSIGIEYAGKGDYDRAADVLRQGTGKTLMDRARAIVTAMKAEEARLLAERSRQVQRGATLLTVSLLLSAVAVGVIALFVTRRARARAQELAVANARLTEEAANRAVAEEQLRQLHKMETIGQLTGGIAHDFNNMLAIVIGSLDLAKRRLAKDRKRAEQSIDNAIQGAERAAQLTARLLAFARRQPLAPAAVDSNRLVGGMSELLRRTIGETIRFETVLAGGLWTAHVDASQLESAVVNLCVNARDAMPEGGRLTIETANTHLDERYAAEHNEVTAGQYVMVSVTDTGSGMPAEVVQRAFDPFFTTKEVGKGTGLGLSQVFGFVKQSGGHVKIYSEPGVGTTVKLYLPRHFGVAAAAETARHTGELPRALDGEKILVVEDEDNVRALSVDALRELGYAVIEASNPADALLLLAGDEDVDLMFTDIVMPGMDGRRLADKAREGRPDLKVLYTTGYTRNAIVHNGVLDHDVHFLAKPFTVAQLAAKVREVLDSQ